MVRDGDKHVPSEIDLTRKTSNCTPGPLTLRDKAAKLCSLNSAAQQAEASHKAAILLDEQNGKCSNVRSRSASAVWTKLHPLTYAECQTKVQIKVEAHKLVKLPMKQAESAT